MGLPPTVFETVASAIPPLRQEPSHLLCDSPWDSREHGWRRDFHPGCVGLRDKVSIGMIRHRREVVMNVVDSASRVVRGMAYYR